MTRAIASAVNIPGSCTRLYLVGLRGKLKDGADARLETFFPGYCERVFAHWFCGTIRAPQGRLIKYVHGGYASTYERDLFIKCDRGVIQEVLVRSTPRNSVKVLAPGLA